MNMELDAVISLDVPNEVIVRRMAGRRVCKNWQEHHIITIPPKQEGICKMRWTFNHP